MAKRQIVLTVTDTNDCPLYLPGERMVLELPEVLRESSDRICALALAEFMPQCRELGIGDDGAEVTGLRCPGCKRGCRATFHASVVSDVSRSNVLRDVARTAEAHRGGDKEPDRKPPFLGQLPAEDVKVLLQRSKVRNFKEPAIIVREGEIGHYLHIVGRGGVDVIKSAGTEHETHLATLGKGDCFGEMSLITGEPSSATVRTIGDDASILSLHKNTVDELVQRMPALAQQFNRILSQRLQDTNRELETEQSRAIGGRISERLGIANVIQTLSQNSQTGRLVIQRKDDTAELVFNGGQIVDATIEAERGEDAVFRIMTLQDGKFNFVDEPQAPPQRSVTRNTTMLLMEGMRRLDESARARVSAGPSELPSGGGDTPES